MHLITRRRGKRSRRKCGRLSALILLTLLDIAFPQLVTEDAGFKSGIDTRVLQEWYSVFDSEAVSDHRIEHRLTFRFDDKTEYRLTVPTVLSREVTFRDPSGHMRTETFSGLGDLKLNVTHSVRQSDDVMWSNRWALLGEVTAPTGQHDDTSGGFDVPRRLQLGTGSWGFGGGTAVTFIRDRHRISGMAMYRHWLRHDGLRPGGSIDLNAAYWYRFYPVQFDGDVDQQELRGVVEWLNRYHLEGKLGDDNLGDDGYESWAVLGLQWFPRPDLLLDFGVQLPLYQPVDDEFGDRRWQAMVGVRFLF